MDKKATIYELKITLKDYTPSIYRRFQVNSSITLNKLHSIIQTVMGWYNCHLYSFDTKLGEIDDDNSRIKTIKLNQIVKEVKDSFDYIYDFGDYWVHKVALFKILDPDPSLKKQNV